MTHDSIRQLVQQAEAWNISQDDWPIMEQLGGQVPNLQDYFGIWSIHAQPFQALVERVNQMDLRVHVQQAGSQALAAERNARRSFQMTEDGVAIIPISGPMMKQVGSLQDGTSTIRVRQQLRAARKDNAVRGAMLVMDTPGGTVRGNQDLAAEILRFRQAKPVHVFVEDMTASAGVSVASQADRVTANNATALYGAIGTYSVLYDSSRMADRLGVQVHVIRAGQFKGAGEPGTPVTDEQLQDLQRIVDALNRNYLGLISRGRNLTMDQVEKMADGRIHPAADAQAMGLIDSVASYDQAYQALLASFQTRGGPTTHARFFQADDPEDPDQADPDDEMEDQAGAAGNPHQPEDQEMAAATLQELKTNFPNSTAEWRESQLEAEASLQDAAISYAAHLEQQLEQQREANQQLDQQLEQRQQQRRGGASSLGHRPLTIDDNRQAGQDDWQGETGDPIQDFDLAVRQVLNGNRHPTRQERMNAVRLAAKRNPQLHQAYLLATNPGRKQQRQIIEKLEDQLPAATS